jgi:heme/copper-type cytochrome/quinol oxidase subunit 3
MSKSRIMMLILVASESFFFLALIISFLYYSRAGGHLSETAQYLNIRNTSIFTFFLLSSSLTIEMADKKLMKGKRRSMLFWLGISIFFGMIFLVGQGMEYTALIRKNITISQNLFGSAFFTLTGFHGLHVLIGLITLTILAGLIGGGKFRAVEYEAFNTTTIYWHFVDAVWVVVFSVVYLASIL